MGKALNQQVIRRTPRSAPDMTVQHAREGDEQAFALLYGAYRQEVLGFVRARVHDAHLAEDLTSDTFLRALGAIGRYSPTGADIGAWFCAIARNLVIDHYRSSRVRREVLVADCRVFSTTTAASAEDSALAVLLREPVRDAVAALPAQHRRTIVLQYWAGWPNDRIGEALGGRTPGAVKALRRRALSRLGTVLGPDMSPGSAPRPDRPS
ncbi:sigma-70 family RNA polymerase sigma factor [Streptomyces sp. t39]|nr:sigma-70 family RNA polymerase sigma factor [Streptomyces sp. t39]